MFIYSFQFLANNTAAILYLTDSENYGQDSVASQYFMQLAQYVRLPLISWNADNSAFEMGSLQLQLAPTLKQQASAMLAILERYSWNTFSIVTGEIAGHSSFEIVSTYTFFHFVEILFNVISWNQKFFLSIILVFKNMSK